MIPRSNLKLSGENVRRGRQTNVPCATTTTTGTSGGGDYYYDFTVVCFGPASQVAPRLFGPTARVGGIYAFMLSFYVQSISKNPKI